jgi:hypothetical protein
MMAQGANGASVPVRKVHHFFGEAFVGTPPQPINALYDTGSW